MREPKRRGHVRAREKDRKTFMGHPESVGGRAGAAEFRHELLGRLGLRASASDQDIEAAHNGLVEFLELAPHGVRSWAAARTTDVDEAFALLSGPEQDLVPPTQIAALAQDGPDEIPQSPAAQAQPAPAAPFAPATPAAPKPRRNLVIGLIAAAATVGIIFGVAQIGKASDVPGISGTPTNQASATAAPGSAPVAVDKAKVAALTKKTSANPKDVASLQGLGDAYFAASDYKNASVWERKILAVDPKNQVALLALGAAQFNLGNAAEAEKNWLVAAKLYPNLAEAHYDLGFLYLSQTPPNKAKMTAEWNKVIAIDPSSSIAKTVATHLKGSQPSATPSAK
jgi:cytochrome c-type biogenesis protein CcmH/NrfG